MIEDQYLTIAGTAAGEPEVRFTQGGAAVANLSVAVNHRRYNKNSGQWEEAGTDWWRINCWRTLAENVGESIHKGDRVIVYGKVASRTWETREGQKVTSWEITAEEIGHSMKFATTVQNRAQRSGGQQQGQRQQGQYTQAAPNDDPWSNPDPGYAQRDTQGQFAGMSNQQGGYDDPPPF